MYTEISSCRICKSNKLDTVEDMFNDGYGYASSLNTRMISHLHTL